MTIETFDNLIQKYTKLADFHSTQSILGDKKYREYHAREEKKYDALIIKIGEKFLKEYHAH